MDDDVAEHMFQVDVKEGMNRLPRGYRVIGGVERRHQLIYRGCRE